LFKCNGCDEDLAKALGADLAVSGYVQKTSNLILAFVVTVKRPPPASSCAPARSTSAATTTRCGCAASATPSGTASWRSPYPSGRDGQGDGLKGEAAARRESASSAGLPFALTFPHVLMLRCEPLGSGLLPARGQAPAGLEARAPSPPESLKCG
jgi:hypothetical protein